MGLLHAQVRKESGQVVEGADIRQMLLAAGAEAHLATPEWVGNHCTLIKWQLACREQYLQDLRGGLLTLPVVLDHLKFR